MKIEPLSTYVQIYRQTAVDSQSGAETQSEERSAVHIARANQSTPEVPVSRTVFGQHKPNPKVIFRVHVRVPVRGIDRKGEFAFFFVSAYYERYATLVLSKHYKLCSLACIVELNIFAEEVRGFQEDSFYDWGVRDIKDLAAVLRYIQFVEQPRFEKIGAVAAKREILRDG